MSNRREYHIREETSGLAAWFAHGDSTVSKKNEPAATGRSSVQAEHQALHAKIGIYKPIALLGVDPERGQTHEQRCSPYGLGLANIRP
jgi:hypothetical protein